MAKAKRATPEGLHTITPVLSVDGAAEAIELLKKAFGAVENSRAMDPTGKKIWHAELRIGDSVLFINDAMPGMSPAWASHCWLYWDDVDARYKQAVAAGMHGEMPPTDMFWGDRHARVTDKFGNVWALATHTDDFTLEEMQQKEAAFIASMQKGQK